MSRGKRLSKGERRWRKKQRESEQTKLDTAVNETAMIATCWHKAAEDFAFHCHERREDLEYDIDWGSLARDIWTDRPGRGGELAEALAAFTAERQRHLDALDELEERFAKLARVAEPHEHLEPIERYRTLVRKRLFEPPQTLPLSSSAFDD